MTAQSQLTQFSADCIVDENGYFHLTGSFDVRAPIAPSESELDQIVDLSDQIGQRIKLTIATATIQEPDQRAAGLAQDVAPYKRRSMSWTESGVLAMAPSRRPNQAKHRPNRPK